LVIDEVEDVGDFLSLEPVDEVELDDVEQGDVDSELFVLISLNKSCSLLFDLICCLPKMLFKLSL